MTTIFLFYRIGQMIKKYIYFDICQGSNKNIWRFSHVIQTFRKRKYYGRQTLIGGLSFERGEGGWVGHLPPERHTMSL